MPAEPLAGLGGPVALAGSSGRANEATGGSGRDSLAIEMLDLLLSTVRGPVCTFFGHDWIGHGQGWYGAASATEYMQCNGSTYKWYEKKIQAANQTWLELGLICNQFVI